MVTSLAFNEVNASTNGIESYKSKQLSKRGKGYREKL